MGGREGSSLNAVLQSGSDEEPVQPRPYGGDGEADAGGQLLVRRPAVQEQDEQLPLGGCQFDVEDSRHRAHPGRRKPA